MLFTVHEVGKKHRMERLLRQSRITSTNVAYVREFFGNCPPNVLLIPCVVNNYNHLMEEVALADQLCAHIKWHQDENGSVYFSG